MASVEALEEEVTELRALVQQALERAMRHGAEHWIEGTDPAARRWQTGAGAPSHVADEGTPYWDTANNNAYVNNDGSTSWTQLTTAIPSGAHTILSTTHTDTDSAGTPGTGDILIRNSSALWDNLRFDGFGGIGKVLGSVNNIRPGWVDASILSVGAVEAAVISSGSITITRSHVVVSPETAGVADDLDNIDAAAAILGSGHLAFFFNGSSNATITFKHLTGNGTKRMFFPDGQDVALPPTTGIWMVAESFGWTPAAPAYHAAYTDADAVAAVPFEIWMPLGHDRGGQPMQA